jgi:eukaryotic-like serine/threonine-protein kinase
LARQLGPYNILAPLGSGGMGEVYRALDSRLKREVAIKLLPGDSWHDPERVKRFHQEAEAAGALNHPNILSIYDTGSENGCLYIVSELVEGESLRKLIQKRPFNTKKLLDLAVQIADGLAAAHDAGIVHRDLKPENIMVTNNERVKILDLGLAKIEKSNQGLSGQETAERITETGVIVGTTTYMSPEQARAELVDFRSDQFSYGMILYEMATGKHPFQQKTVVQTLSAIVSEEPVPILMLNQDAPPSFCWLVERCLKKDRRQRYASTFDLYQEICSIRDHLDKTLQGSLQSIPKKSFSKMWIFPVLISLALFATLFLTKLTSKSGIDLSSYRFTALSTDSPLALRPSWSPDGKNIAYVGEVEGSHQVFVHSLASSTDAQITRSEQDCDRPFWSPDGNRIYYFSGPRTSTLYSISTAGGISEVVAEDAYEATISSNGTIIAFIRQGKDTDSIWISNISSSPKKYQTAPFATKGFWWGTLRFSPDSSKIAAYIAPRDQSTGEFWILPYPSGTPYRVLTQVTALNFFSFDWMPDNTRIVFSNAISGNSGIHLHVANTLNDTTTPITLTQNNEINPAVSPDGTMISFQHDEEDYDLIEIPLDGSSIHTLLATSRNESYPTWSEHSNEYAYSKGIWGAQGIWLRNNLEQSEKPLVSATNFSNLRTEELSFPTFSPDGTRLAYYRLGEGRSGIWVSRITGGTPVWISDGQIPTWSPDGNWIAFPLKINSKRVLAKVNLGSNESPTILTKENVIYDAPQWSPRGNWISCITTTGLTLVSPEGTAKILSERKPEIHGWSKDGSFIYAIGKHSNSGWLLYSIDPDTGKEKMISELGLSSINSGMFGYSLSADGKRIATSLKRGKSEIWILEGFEKKSFFGQFFDRIKAWGPPGGSSEEEK